MVLPTQVTLVLPRLIEKPLSRLSIEWFPAKITSSLKPKPASALLLNSQLTTLSFPLRPNRRIGKDELSRKLQSRIQKLVMVGAETESGSPSPVIWIEHEVPVLSVLPRKVRFSTPKLLKSV